MLQKPTVVSLFSGCGGLDLGFESAGFDTRVMVETMPFACETLRANFPKARVIGPPTSEGDVRDVDGEAIGIPEPDVLIGGPPCQSFSVAAAQRFLKGDAKFKRIGFDDEVRGNLIHEYLRILADLKPRVFVIENVPGLQRIDDGETVRGIVETCRTLGYKVATPQVLQAAEYGVPQLRQRLIIVGARDETPGIPKPTHVKRPSTSLRSYSTVAEAIHGLQDGAPNHVPRVHMNSSIERYRRLEVGRREHLGRVDRLDPREPSKTVIAGGSNGGGRSHLHPFLARTLTVRECARLQTFPDSFVFQGTMSRQFTQVGNAVPPLLAEVLARSIGRQFFGLRFDAPLVHGLSPGAPSAEECVSWLAGRAKSEPQLLYNDLSIEHPDFQSTAGVATRKPRYRELQRV